MPDKDNVEKKDVTMVLDLSQYHPELQRAQVIHMFGHALWLEHEHQRPNSDFWNVVSQHIDMEKMKKDVTSVCPGNDKGNSWFERCWMVKGKTADTSRSEHDFQSIMHFRYIYTVI